MAAIIQGAINVIEMPKKQHAFLRNSTLTIYLTTIQVSSIASNCYSSSIDKRKTIGNL